MTVPAQPPEHVPPPDGALIAVLLVANDPAEVELILELLADAEHVLVVTHVASIDAAVAHLAGSQPHAILFDLLPPDALHLDALRRLRAAACGIPIVVLTGIEQPALARDAILLGVEEYLLKRALDGERLAGAVLRAVERAGVRRTASEVRAAFRQTSLPDCRDTASPSRDAPPGRAERTLPNEPPKR